MSNNKEIEELRKRSKLTSPGEIEYWITTQQSHILRGLIRSIETELRNRGRFN